jgi:hypothetical protein
MISSVADADRPRESNDASMTAKHLPLVLIVAMGLASASGFGCGARAQGEAPEPARGADQPPHSAYDTIVLADHPVLFLSMGAAAPGGVEPDLSGFHHDGHYGPGGAVSPNAPMPNGDPARRLDGAGQYLEVASAPSLSVPTTGVLSIEAWIAPDVLQFVREEGSGYVYWLGKGERGAFEYAGRMYSLETAETPPRPNRISVYAFNPAGGLGSGSYFQDMIQPRQWIHVVAVINAKSMSPSAPSGSVTIFRDGVARKTTGLDQFNVVPVAGAAPLRIGTLNLHSFFAGSIGKVALYDYELSAQQILRHTQAMAATR